MKSETRISTDLRIETRADRPAPRIVGYAARFGSETTIGGRFREVIQRGAFSRAIGDQADILATVNHNESRLIGRTRSGTLEVREDDQGLWFSVEPPDTSEGRDLLTLMQRGDLSGASFAFRVPQNGERWERGADLPLRTLTDLDLVDVSVVTVPAYPDASVALRSLAAAEITAEKELREAKLAERLAKLRR